MTTSNRFKASRKNKGSMTFAIGDNDWKALKILCDFYHCSPGELIAALLREAIRGYRYHEVTPTETVGE